MWHLPHACIKWERSASSRSTAYSLYGWIAKHPIIGEKWNLFNRLCSLSLSLSLHHSAFEMQSFYSFIYFFLLLVRNRTFTCFELTWKTRITCTWWFVSLLDWRNGAWCTTNRQTAVETRKRENSASSRLHTHTNVECSTMKTRYAYRKTHLSEWVAGRMASNKNRKIANRFESKLIEFFDLFVIAAAVRWFQLDVTHGKIKRCTFFGPKTEKCIT